VVEPGRAIALMRNAHESRRILRASTDDAGRTWSKPTATAMPNPDAALDALALDDGRLLVALNDTEHSRERLVLAVTDRLGGEWRRIAVLENRSRAESGATPEHSYPSLLRDGAGIFHEFYTWNRERIKHVAFDQRWLDHAASTAVASTAAPSSLHRAVNREHAAGP
jgi:predicted neuraminidase